jgi:uncharacterized membrane protein YfcA
MLGLELHHFAALFLAALVAGFVDAIAGGGGIITIPALMAVGLPPHLVLGTNKCQACFGSAMATWRYAGSGLMEVRKMGLIIVWTAIGAAVGTITIQHISQEILRHVMVVLLFILFVYSCLVRDFGREHRPHRMPHAVFAVLFGLLLGFYDGFFGPGTGTFWTIAFVMLMGLDLRRATGHTKVVNLTSNIVSLIFFLAAGQVVVLVGLIMGVGQAIGAHIGSHMVLKRGIRFIRACFLCVVALTLCRLIYTTYLR